MSAEPDTPCLRPACTRPTVYGSPACADHWQAWRDEEQRRIEVEWDLDMVPSEFQQEQDWLREREEARALARDDHLEDAIEREGRFAQDIRDAAEG